MLWALRRCGEGGLRRGAGRVVQDDGAHTCTRTLTHTEALSHTCLHRNTAIPTAHVISTHPCIYTVLIRIARHVRTPITPSSQGSFHTIMLMPRQVMPIYMYTASHIQYKFCLCTHTPRMCTHRSYVGLCQCAHTQAAHNPIQLPPSTHMRGNQSKELCKSHRPCLRARAALYEWSLVPAPPPSTKDTQLRTMTEGCTLRSQG